MGIEGGRLEHLREGQLHFIGKCCEVISGNLAVFVLDQVQMLNQQVAPPRTVAEQLLDFVQSLRIDLPALWS